MLKHLVYGYCTKYLHSAPQPHPLTTFNSLKIQIHLGRVASRCHHKVYPHNQSNSSQAHNVFELWQNVLSNIGVSVKTLNSNLYETSVRPWKADVPQRLGGTYITHLHGGDGSFHIRVLQIFQAEFILWETVKCACMILAELLANANCEINCEFGFS